MEIFELSTRRDIIDDAVQYFWECWGNEANFNFYQDCIQHSLKPANKLPKFFLAIDQDRIIGCYALLINDLVSRQDLYPWFACLYVNESMRNQGVAGQLLDHALVEANKRGFEQLYLSTDLEGFYEKKGWQHRANAFNVFGEKFKVYARDTN